MVWWLWLKVVVQLLPSHELCALHLLVAGSLQVSEDCFQKYALWLQDCLPAALLQCLRF